MAPYEDGCVKTVAEPGGFCFWNRLNTLPVVQSTIETTVGIYSSSKEKHALIGKGLNYLEYGVVRASEPVKKVATAIVEKYPVAGTTATRLDHLACNCLETLENKVPALQKPPGELVSNVKKGTSSALHTSVRKVMRTYPGLQMVKALDNMIEWSEVTLDLHEVKKMAAKELGNGEVEHAEDGEEQKKDDQPTLTLKNGAVIPLKLYLQALKLVKHMLANMAGLKTRPASASASPRKTTDVSRRKKASPKKRLANRSLVTRLTTSALTMLGVRASEDTVKEDLCQHLKAGENDAVNERNDKRKHDEDTDDDDIDSDCESLNLASALDNYNSGEDSDYVPGHDPSDDSLEYSSGDSESDVETEEAGRSKKGGQLRQIVDRKSQGKKLLSANFKSPESSANPPLPTSKSPKVILQPEWKQKPEEQKDNKPNPE